MRKKAAINASGEARFLLDLAWHFRVPHPEDLLDVMTSRDMTRWVAYLEITNDETKEAMRRNQ